MKSLPIVEVNAADAATDLGASLEWYCSNLSILVHHAIIMLKILENFR